MGNTSLGQVGYMGCIPMAAASMDSSIACYIKTYSVTFLITYAVSLKIIMNIS